MNCKHREITDRLPACQIVKFPDFLVLPLTEWKYPAQVRNCGCLNILLTQLNGCRWKYMLSGDLYAIKSSGVQPATRISFVWVMPSNWPTKWHVQYQPRPSVSIFKNFGTAHFKIQDPEGMWLDVEFVGARKESYRAASRNPDVESRNTGRRSEPEGFYDQCACHQPE